LKGIVSASVMNPNSRTCEGAQHALFTDILQYLDWIEDPKGEKPKCGVMTRSTGLIQGGSFSTREQFPWQVSILAKQNNEPFGHRGSGSLISMKHVLTTAASVGSVVTKKLLPLSIDRIKLFLGTLKYDEATFFGSIEVDSNGIAEILVHPNARYDLLHIANIAIISLKNRIQSSSFISPVCLWREGDDIDKVSGQISYGVGYGINEMGKVSGVRKQARMLITSNSYCNQFYDTKAVQSKYLCAQGDVIELACKGDGPLYIKRSGAWFIRALGNSMFSFPNGTCDPQKPILYEDLAYYKDWIADNARDV